MAYFYLYTQNLRPLSKWAKVTFLTNDGIDTLALILILNSFLSLLRAFFILTFKFTF